MKEEGPRLGHQNYGDQTTRNGSGSCVVANPAQRAQTLGLGENPQIASYLAAAFTLCNGEYLRSVFGRTTTAGELYIAHFLGTQRAERMFKTGSQNPDQVAVMLFPRHAAVYSTTISISSGIALVAGKNGCKTGDGKHGGADALEHW